MSEKKEKMPWQQRFIENTAVFLQFLDSSVFFFFIQLESKNFHLFSMYLDSV